MDVYGNDWSRRELEARTGRMEQYGGLKRYTLEDGPERGLRMVEVRTGGGLRFLLSPDRGMDIGLAEFAGTPFTWLSPNGAVHPSYFRYEGIDWLRTAAGGLLMTCGYTQVGSPCEERGEKLGLHGRAHHLAADQVNASGVWDETEQVYTLAVSGVLRESRIFGENIEVKRLITAFGGQNRLHIQDRIRNAGFESSPYMILYHFNFGFPLISESAELKFPSSRVTPREPETPVEGYDRWQAPDAGYEERVYYHSRFETRKEKGREMATVAIRNPDFPIAGNPSPVEARLSWSVDSLPSLVQWKMPGAGTHVLGIEPSNGGVGGRKAERDAGTLDFIEPGQLIENQLDLDLRHG